MIDAGFYTSGPIAVDADTVNGVVLLAALALRRDA